MAEFKDRVKELRKERGLSQQNVADALGFNKMTISGYERGVRKPHIDTLNNLAIFFDVDIMYLMGRTDIRSHFPKPGFVVSGEERDLINKYRELDETGKALVRLAACVED